ncbi:unnamed protein product [Onchocerca flexuosa]|uniref:Transposase n=1 Tax=Onchocerca flexuosa TaxID=387005 RepID=A0A183HVM2_9BILA|nr:unnamed protein product [Onchocerca flexuosa]
MIANEEHTKAMLDAFSVAQNYVKSNKTGRKKGMIITTKYAGTFFFFFFNFQNK